MIGIVVEWMVGMGERSEFEVIWNQKDEKMQYFSSADINNTTLLNYAKKKAEILCRGKWNKNTASDSILCYDGSDVTVTKGKTVIIKNWSGTISPESSSNGSSYYDVFVNNWNLIISETNDKFVFTKDGFINTSSSANQFNTNVGNNPDNYNWNDVAVWSFIKWNFIVNWYVKGSWWGKLKNKYFVHWKFTTKDDFTSLLDTFAWRCVNGISTEESDGKQSYCPPSSNYAVASLVVIDQNYDSPFFVN